MNIRTILIAATLSMIGLPVGYAQSPASIISSYDNQLANHPNDYETLYNRGAIYYKLGRLEEAFEDITSALKYTPRSNKAMRVSEYSMISDLLSGKGEYEGALKAIDDAIAEQGATEMLLFKKGEMQLQNGKGDDAYHTFEEMRKLSPGNADALWGMAKARALAGKEKDALELLSEAMQSSPDNSMTMCRKGEVMMMMSMYTEAADSFISAYLKSPGYERAYTSLLSLSAEHYDQVESAFQIRREDRADDIPLLRLQAKVATGGERYADAYDLYVQLVKDMPGSPDAALDYEIANTAFYAGKYAAAGKYVNEALTKDLSMKNMVLKSRIDLAMGNRQQALSDALSAAGGSGDRFDALVQTAICCMAQNKGKKALEYLDNAIASRPDNIEALMLRAYVKFQLLNRSQDSLQDYMAVAKMEPLGAKNIAYVCMAYCFIGDVDGGYQIMEDYLKSLRQPTTKDLYYAAVFYSQTGNLGEAESLLDRAIEGGFQNVYYLKTDKTANLNIAPVRHLFRN